MQNNPLKALFPQLVGAKPLIYLDSAATSHKPLCVIERINQYYSNENANVHRSNHTLAAQTTAKFETVRQQVQHFIGAKSDKEIIWTKGATESINLVANCLSTQHLQTGQKILLSALEHHANLVPWQQMAQRFALQIHIMPVDDKGCLLIEQALQLIDSQTALVAVTHVSNTLGNINPIELIIKKAKALGAMTLIDGAQAISHLKVDVQALDCDFYVFSAHKMYGPTGIGVLYGKQALLESMSPYQYGGEMIQQVGYFDSTFQGLPYKFEAGTPNIAGVLGLGAAVAFIEQHRALIDQIESELYAYLLQQLAQIKQVQLWGETKSSIALQSITLIGLNIQDLSILLSEQNIAIRTGHHCTMPLMQRLGLAGTLRISLACYNTFADIDAFMQALKNAMLQLAPDSAIQDESNVVVASELWAIDKILPLAQKIKAAQGWDSVYREIMIAGKELNRLPVHLQVAEYEVNGCESQVWLSCEVKNQHLHLQGDSPSKIVRGLLAIIFEVLQGQNVQSIAVFDMAAYLQQLGLSRHLSPSRGNGLLAVVQFIKLQCELACAKN
jgi:cysteine desulfurase / selenocysteine lyase